MEQTELLELIQRSRQGDMEAQEALILAAQNKVYYHCKKMLKHEQDAQDAAQDVLITMITSLDKLKEPAAFWGWVNGITANRCRHLLSVPHKEWQIPEDEEGNSMLDDMENLDETLVPDKALDNEETRRIILELVDGLSPEQRMSVGKEEQCHEQKTEGFNRVSLPLIRSGAGGWANISGFPKKI